MKALITLLAAAISIPAMAQDATPQPSPASIPAQVPELPSAPADPGKAQIPGALTAATPAALNFQQYAPYMAIITGDQAWEADSSRHTREDTIFLRIPTC